MDDRINEAIKGENTFAMEVSESAYIKSLKAAKHIKVGYGKTNPNIARKKKKWNFFWKIKNYFYKTFSFFSIQK